MWNRVRRHRFARGVGVLVTGTAFGQGIGVLTSPIITRLYEPADYGVLAAYASFLGILGGVAALSYQYPIPLARKDTIAVNVLALAGMVVGVVAGVTAVGVLVTGDWLSAALEMPQLGALLWLLPLGILGAGSYKVLSFWGLRRKAYARIARTKLSQSLGGAATQVGMGLVQAGPIGLLLGHIVGQAGGILSLLRSSWAEDRSLWRHVSLRRMRIVAWRYRRFPQLNSGSTLLNSGGAYAAPLLLVTLYGAQVAGLFALADRIASTPIRLIGTSVGQVYLSEAAQLADQPRRIASMMWKTMRLLAGMAALPALGLLLFGDDLFAFVFGEPWREAGVYAAILSPWLFLKFVTSPVSQNFNILERQDLGIYFNLVRFLLVVSSLSVPAWLGIDTVGAVMSYTAAMSLSYVLLVALNLVAIRSSMAAGA